MTFAICRELNYAIIKKFGIKSSGNFIEKIITYRLNEIRKQICRQSVKFSGYTYRVIRAYSKDTDTTKTMQRNYPKYFHEWMLQWKEPTYIAKKQGRPFGTNNSVNQAPGSKARGLGPYNNYTKKKNKNTKMTRKELMADIAVQEDEMKDKRLLLASLKNDDEDDDSSKLIVIFFSTGAML